MGGFCPGKMNSVGLLTSFGWLLELRVRMGESDMEFVNTSTFKCMPLLLCDWLIGFVSWPK